MRLDAARLIGSWSLAHVGYRAALIAMPLLAFEQTGSAWTVGLVSGAGGIPAITAPWWTGRFQRRLASAGALALLLVGEGLATLVVPASAGLDLLTPALMVTAGLLVGVLNAVSGPLNASLVAAVGDELDARRTTAGSEVDGTGAARLLALQETAVKIAMTVAPLLALPLVAVVGAAWTVAAEGILSLAAAGLVATLRLSSAPKDDEAPNPRVRALVRRHPAIARGWMVRGVGCAAWFAFTLGLPLLGQRQGSGVLLATVGLTSYALGAVAGSALGVRTATSARPALLNSASWLVAGPGWLAMAMLPRPSVVAGAAVVMGLVVPAGNAATTAMVTRSCTGLERRAALTAQATVVTGASTFGMLVGGPLMAVIGIQAAMASAGGLVTIVAAVVAIGEYSRERRDTRQGRSLPTDARTQPRSTARKVSHDGERWPSGELPRLQRGQRGPAAVDR